MLSRQRPVLWFGNLTVMIVCCVVLWDPFPHGQIIKWCASNFALAVVRLWDWRRFNREQPDDPHKLQRWMLHMMFYSGVGGAIWGAGAMLFLDSTQLLQMIFLLTVLMGIGTGALPALCPHYGAFATFVVPIFLPLSVKLWLLGEPITNVLAGFALFFLVIVLFFGRNLSAAITNSITRDIENARLLDEVTVAKNAAERANVEKSGFLAAVSHDLRQPLYAMGLFLGSLDRDVLDERNRELVDDIDNAYAALEDMFSALLEISRLDAGAVEPERMHFPIDELLVRLVPQFRHAAEIKNIEFEFEDSAAIIHSDPVLLERVLRNLLSNAVKYTDGGKVSLEIGSAADETVIRVADTGHGIPESDLDRIFDEYHQLENPERDRSKGLGLGLSVVRRTCTLLAHPLSVESTLGRGSAFTVSVPQGDPEKIARPAAPDESAGIAGLHVVVIDDEAQIRKGMTTLLTDSGCVVTAAADDEDVLLMLKEISRPPDVLICDYRLRDGRTGLEAIERLRAAIDPELPALIMTGDTHAHLQEAAERLGLYVLHKPVKIPHLMKVVRELV